MEVIERNSLVLAYLGDTIYEYYIRKYLLELNIPTVDNLQKEAVNYVSARSQASFLKKMIEKELLTEEELTIIRRARNHKSNSHPKSCDIITYKHATALEALIGYLELTGNRRRIEEIMDYILGGVLC